ncbi:YraN family protein [Patescibacteria group bacterium]|nr:YraN family protein [Patescibacteria group bacterium]
MRRKSLGNLGENLALKHLKNKGYKILDRNFRSKLGEIDVIAIDPSSTISGKDTLVFIEVKTRWSKKFGLPEEGITLWKIRRIIKTGQYYKLVHPELPDSLRLDAVVIDLSSQGKLKRIEIIKNLTS